MLDEQIAKMKMKMTDLDLTTELLRSVEDAIPQVLLVEKNENS